MVNGSDVLGVTPPFPKLEQADGVVVADGVGQTSCEGSISDDQLAKPSVDPRGYSISPPKFHPVGSIHWKAADGIDEGCASNFKVPKGGELEGIKVFFDDKVFLGKATVKALAKRVA